MMKQKCVQYTVPVRSEPESVHQLVQVIAKEEINIKSLMVESIGSITYVRFLTDRENNIVRRPLEVAGYEVFENPCFQVELPNRPGEFSWLAKRLGDENIKILNLYGTTDGAETGKFTLTTDQPEKTQAVISHLTEHATAGV